MPRFVTDSRPISAQHPIIEFYAKNSSSTGGVCKQQRPYYSESAITDVEAASHESSPSSNNSTKPTLPS